MEIDLAYLQPTPMSLKGFTGDLIQPVVTITLSILAGKAPHTTSMMTNFIVRKVPSLYNAILRQLKLNFLKALTSTYHLKMKFPIATRVSEIHSKQVLV